MILAYFANLIKSKNKIPAVHYRHGRRIYSTVVQTEGGDDMTEREKTALGYIPDKLCRAVRQASGDSPVSEIRLRRGRELYVTVREKSVPCGVTVTDDDIDSTVLALAEGSLYAVAEEMREGVITTESGIRAGIAGKACVTDGKITSVRGIGSVNIRIPHRVPHAADGLYKAVTEYGSVLVFSPPGMGKTTSLGELLPLLSGGEKRARVAVIDTRHELSFFSAGSDCADFFEGYPRRAGIVSAVTSMSPEYIVCDEISTEDDADAILYAASCGVSTVCSAHARDINELCRNPSVAGLIRSGAFGALYGLGENGGETYPIGDFDQADGMRVDRARGGRVGLP